VSRCAAAAEAKEGEAVEETKAMDGAEELVQQEAELDKELSFLESLRTGAMPLEPADFEKDEVCARAV
jgi:hypothetical protein